MTNYMEADKKKGRKAITERESDSILIIIGGRRQTISVMVFHKNANGAGRRAWSIWINVPKPNILFPLTRNVCNNFIF